MHARGECDIVTEMGRHIVTKAVVLHTYRVGEIHKSVALFTPDHGLVYAMAHGAKKETSRLRSATETFCLSKIYLYHEPVKDRYKITEAVPEELYYSIRETLPKFYTACLWAEIILKSFGGGEKSAVLFQLFRSCLDMLSREVEKRILYISIQFIWRFLHHSGLVPGLDVCSHCGKTIVPEERIFLSIYNTGFVCPDCSLGSQQVLSSGSRKYLTASLQLQLEQAAVVSLEENSLRDLRDILYALIEGILEARINSVRMAGGVG